MSSVEDRLRKKGTQDLADRNKEELSQYNYRVNQINNLIPKLAHIIDLNPPIGHFWVLVEGIEKAAWGAHAIYGFDNSLYFNILSDGRLFMYDNQKVDFIILHPINSLDDRPFGNSEILKEIECGLLEFIRQYTQEPPKKSLFKSLFG